LCVIGFSGLGCMLVCISFQIEHCRVIVLRLLVLNVVKPPGYKAIEYYPDGAIKRVETMPEDAADMRHKDKV
jgi:hypothetical protein